MLLVLIYILGNLHQCKKLFIYCSILTSDINDCEGNAADCQFAELCQNIPGSFKCDCPDGFLKNETDTTRCTGMVNK